MKQVIYIMTPETVTPNSLPWKGLVALPEL